MDSIICNDPLRFGCNDLELGLPADSIRRGEAALIYVAQTYICQH